MEHTKNILTLGLPLQQAFLSTKTLCLTVTLESQINLIITKMIWAILLLCAEGVRITTHSIYASTREIKEQANYDFSIKVINEIPEGGQIKVEFPQMFESLPSPVLCSISGVASPEGVECTFQENTLYITGAFPSTSESIQWTVYSITNPQVAKTSESFRIFTMSQSGSILDELTSGETIEFQPKQLLSARLSPGSQVSSELSEWTIELTTGYTVSGGVVIVLDLPYWNQGLNPPQHEEFCSGSTSCKGLVNFSETPLCSCSQSTLSISGESSEPGYIKLTVSQLKNPPNTEAVTGFSLYTSYNSGKIEEKLDLSVQVTLPSLVNIPSYNHRNSQINQVTDISFEVTCNSPIPESAQMTIAFPRDFEVSESLSSSIEGYFGVNFNMQFSISENSFLVSDCFTGYLDSTETIEFLVRNVKNPFSTKPTKPIEIAIKTASDSLICQNEGLSIQATPGNMQGVSVEPESATVNANTIYTFKFEPLNSVPAGGTIKITAPHEIKFENRSKRTCFYVESGVSPNAQCEVTENKYLFVTNGFPENYSGVVEFKVNNVVNPSTALVTEPFTIQTSLDAEFLYFIDQDTSVAVSSTPGDLTKVLVEPFVPYADEVTSYSFIIETSNPIPQGGVVKVSFPPEITIEDTTQACTSPIGFEHTFKCMSTSSQVTIKEGFLSQMFLPGQLGFTLHSVKNPPTTQESGSFSVSTLSESYLVDQLNSVVTLEASCRANWAEISSVCYECNPKCQTCSGTTDNCTSCGGNYPFKLNSTCVDECPSHYFLSENECLECHSSCGNCQGTASNCTSCFEDKKLYKNTCIDSCTPGTQIELSQECFDCSLDCLTCEVSVSKCTSCKANRVFYKDECLSSCPKDSTLTIEGVCYDCSNSCVTCAGSTDSCTSCYDGFFLHESKCLSSCPSGYARIDKVCQECSSQCKECFGDINYCTKCEQGKFRYKGNCISACPQGETITYGDECLDCASNCKICEGSPDNCLECQDNKFLYQNQCIETCPPGTFKSGVECRDCDSSCRTCSGSSVKCTSCSEAMHLYEGICLETCPSGTISFDTECLGCKEPCLTCYSSTSTCSSCKASFYLFESLCVEECPQGYTPQDFQCVRVEAGSQNCAEGCTLELLNNNVCDLECNNQDCNFDDGMCLESTNPSSQKTNEGKERLAIEQSPFPLSCVGTFSFCVLSLVKFYKGGSLVGGSVSVMSILETTSRVWVGCLLLGSESESRRLMESEQVSFALYGLLGILLGELFMNMVFLIMYLGVFMRADKVHCEWAKSHKKTMWFTVGLCLVSFKFIRFILCNLLDSCCAKFGKKTSFYKQLVVFCFVSLLLVSVPVGALLTCTLFWSSQENLLFAAALDALIVTVFGVVLLVLDMVQMGVVIGKESKELFRGTKVQPEFEATTEMINTERNELESETLRETFKETFRGSPSETINFSFSAPQILQTIESQEELDLETAQVDSLNSECIVITHCSGKKVVVKKPFQEDTTDNLNEYYLVEVEPTYAVFKHKQTNQEVLVNRSIKGAKIIDIEDTWRGWKIGREVISEQDFDFGSAKIDPNDLEAVLVRHKDSGYLVKVKQGFQGVPARNPHTNLPSSELVQYSDTSELNIEQGDIHCAYLVLKGEYVKARRSFSGAAVTDVLEASGETSPKFSVISSPLCMSFKGPEVSFSQDLSYSASENNTPKAFAKVEEFSFEEQVTVQDIEASSLALPPIKKPTKKLPGSPKIENLKKRTVRPGTKLEPISNSGSEQSFGKVDIESQNDDFEILRKNHL